MVVSESRQQQDTSSSSLTGRRNVNYDNVSLSSTSLTWFSDCDCGWMTRWRRNEGGGGGVSWWTINTHNDRRNLISVTFIMFGLGLVSTALLSAGWFEQNVNPECTKHLAPYLFWDPGSFTEHYVNLSSSSNTNIRRSYKSYDCYAGKITCINPEVVMFMRWIIALCVMSLIFGLVTFYLDVTGPTQPAGLKVQEHGSITVMFLITLCLIMSLTYLAKIVWEQELGVEEGSPEELNAVRYEYGFWTIVAASWFGFMSLMSTWIKALTRRMHRWRRIENEILDPERSVLSASGVEFIDDTENLLGRGDGRINGLRGLVIRGSEEETFIHRVPPPPYSVSASLAAPPPYVP